MKKKFFGFAVFAVIFLAVCFGLFQISKSRSFQFFGAIYPRVETNKKVVALTFDDGPSREHTGEILRILREEKTKATFYVTGTDIEKNPGELEKIIAEGHEIGNHSYTHKRMVLVTPSFVKSEIETTDQLIRRAGWTKEITFRPPFGKKLFALPFYLSQNDRKTVTWDVEPETFFEKSDEIIKNTLGDTKNGSIILLHVMYDSRAETRKAVKPIIENLRAQGFEFVTVSELLRLKEN